MSRLEIQIIPCLSDNYAYLLRDAATGTTAVIDPSEEDPVLAALEKNGWQLDYILNTHHHWDHTGGNPAVKKATGCQIVGSRIDHDRIPGIDIEVDESDTFRLGEAEAEIFVIPGHTKGHIAFYFPESRAVFSGDTLFSLGCGRVFEGTSEQMWNSLDRFRQLPDDTLLYCGHEYTVKNAQFALTVEPDNAAIQARLRRAQELRAQGKPTVPSTMAEENAANPFLRADSVEVFAARREAKDRF